MFQFTIWLNVMLVGAVPVKHAEHVVLSRTTVVLATVCVTPAKDHCAGSGGRPEKIIVSKLKLVTDGGVV